MKNQLYGKVIVGIMKEVESQKRISNKYAPCKLFCMMILMSLALLFSPFAHAIDNMPSTPYITENLSKELEDSLINAEKEGRLMDYYIEKESIFRDKGRYSDIIDMSNWVEDHISKDDINGLTLIYELRSAAFYVIGDYDRMFDDIEKSLEIPKDKNLLFRNGILYLWLTDFHLRFNRLDIAQQYLAKAKQIAYEHEDFNSNDEAWRDLYLMLHLMQGQILSIQGKWDAANAEYEKAHEYAFCNSHFNGLILQKFFFYKNKGDYEMAENMYKEYMLNNNPPPYPDNGILLIGYIDLLLKKGDIFNAEQELKKINPNCITTSDQHHLYSSMSEMYRVKGNYQLAYYYLNKSLHIKDSLDLEYKNVYSRYATDRFEMRQVEKSLEKERLENLRNSFFIVILCIALIAAGVWVGIVIRRHSKRKRDQVIAESNLGNRNAALSSAVLVADNYKNICQDIKSILSSDVEIEQKISEINKRLKDSNNPVEPLHHVSSTNEESMQEFMDKLRYVHPDLTNAELRIAQMIFMNISNKDIAELQNRSLGTIKNQKYSLRKKLGTEMPMEQYLKQISAASNSELELLAKSAQQKNKR